MVEPDRYSQSIVIHISISDEGFEPSTIFLPAGRHTKLVLRNRGSAEHHYRVAGLIPASMRWLMMPEVDESDVLSMSPEELAALGLGGEIKDVEQALHHVTPRFVPSREESPAGIQPLSNEVHGYVTGDTRKEVLEFYPTNTGTFVIEDVLHPGETGKAIVFDPAASDA